MKKILLTLGLAMLASFGFSQMNTGSYFISGSIPLNLQLYSGSSKDTPDLKEGYQYINFAPKGGYFIKNRIAIGGMVDFSVDRQKFKNTASNTEDINKTTTILVGPMGRMYYEYGKLMPFAEAFLGFGRSTNKYLLDGFSESVTSHSVFKVAGGGGAHYFLTEALAFEALLQYFWEKQNPTEGIGAGHAYTGILLLVGITIYFGSI